MIDFEDTTTAFDVNSLEAVSSNNASLNATLRWLQTYIICYGTMTDHFLNQQHCFIGNMDLWVVFGVQTVSFIPVFNLISNC